MRKRTREKKTVEEVRESLEGLEKRTRTNPGVKVHMPRIPVHSTSRLQEGYAWLYGVTDQGKRVVLGPCADESEAEGRADDLNDYEIYVLPTRNQASATRMIKAQLLKEGQPTDEAIERTLHQKGLDRALGKR